MGQSITRKRTVAIHAGQLKWPLNHNWVIQPTNDFKLHFRWLISYDSSWMPLTTRLHFAIWRSWMTYSNFQFINLNFRSEYNQEKEAGPEVTGAEFWGGGGSTKRHLLFQDNKNITFFRHGFRLVLSGWSTNQNWVKLNCKLVRAVTWPRWKFALNLHESSTANIPTNAPCKLVHVNYIHVN